MTRAPNAIQRQHYADTLQALATFLISTAADDALNTLNDTRTVGYPTTTSGVNTTATGVNPNGSTTERTALTDNHPANDADALIVELWRHHRRTEVILDRLQACLPDRHIPRCDACQFPIDSDRRCHNDLCPSKEWPRCTDCAKPMAPGDRRNNKHDACRKYYERNGYTKASVTKYATAPIDILVDGAYVDEDD